LPGKIFPSFVRNELLPETVAALGLVWTALSLTVSPLEQAQQAWLQKAERHEKDGWVYVHLEGAPRERGFQHGYLLAREIEQGLKATRASWTYQSALEWSWLVEQAAGFWSGRIDPENLAELDGLVEGLRAAGVVSSRTELIAYNGIFELSGYWWPGELKRLKEGPVPPVRESCSSFIATGNMTTDGNVVLGHNTMMSYCDVFPNIVADIVPEKGHRMLMQTCPGWATASGLGFETSCRLEVGDTAG
jgi:hypothetical protein